MFIKVILKFSKSVESLEYGWVLMNAFIDLYLSTKAYIDRRYFPPTSNKALLI